MGNPPASHEDDSEDMHVRPTLKLVMIAWIVPLAIAVYLDSNANEGNPIYEIGITSILLRLSSVVGCYDAETHFYGICHSSPDITFCRRA